MIERFWLTNDDKYLEDNYSYKSVSYISKKLNRTNKAIYHRASFLGLKDFKRWNINEDNFLKFHYKNKSVLWISKKLNRTIKAIYSRTGRLNGISNNIIN